MRSIIAMLCCLLPVFNAAGQGTIRGKISDNNGEALIGATVSIKSTTIGKSTDLNGSYSLQVNDSAVHALQVSYVGYKMAEELVRVRNGEVLIRNLTLIPAASKLGEVIVVGKAVRSRDGYMDKIKQNSASTLDYVSSESMKKSGDVTIIAAVTRIAGVSTNGGFITVRGIGDRYILTTVNGLRIPTLDPFTNNIRLDMFPASLVDNVMITKTASADLPGNWAGAYLSVETKDYPDKLIVDVETGLGYNAQTSFNDYVTTPHSATDWLGYDNGYRNKSINNFVALKPIPSLYDEFVALGLGPYFSSMGINKAWTSSSAGADTYYRLGLVQLGLLSKNEFDNVAAVTAAKFKYDHGDYHARAFDIINAQAVRSNQRYPNNWRTMLQKAPLGYTQSACIGNQVKLFGKPLGFIGGFRYASYVESDPNAFQTRVNSSKSINGVPSDVDTAFGKVGREVNSWSALLNLAYKYHPNHSISLLFMPNMTGNNNALMGTMTGNNQTYNERQYYESRKQLIYQLKSEHYIPRYKSKIEGDASYTDGSSNAPDFKVVKVPINPQFQNQPVIVGQRSYRYLKERVFDSRIASEMALPGDKETGKIRKLKFGIAFQEWTRRSDQYLLNLDNGQGAFQMTANDPGSDPYSMDKFGFSSVVLGGMPTHSVLRYYDYNDLPYNHAMGRSTVLAAYLMTDFSLNSRIRFSPGLRVEKAQIHTDVSLYDSLQLPANDQRRHSDQYLINNPANLDNLNFLPSINVICKLRRDMEAPLNLRFGYSQTVTRPSLRELSDISMYDYVLNDLVTGSPDLKSTIINNYDIRLESYFKSNDYASVSLFYKAFSNLIELVNFSPYGYYWINNPNKAWLTGIELEGRKVFFKHLELKTNVTLADSRSFFAKRLALGGGGVISNGEMVSHTMFGQAPYVINAMLSYAMDSLRLVATVSYNLQGPRLVIDGGNGIPDVYELPRQLVDIKLAKKIGKHFLVSIKISDLLNTASVRAYKYPAGYILDYDRFRYGTTYVLGVGYKL
ncbi:MAG: carboxypeptidase-like regulatory domain-containing protein [Bacteroidia bacterium]